MKPILFNTAMVRAILAGEKTCTRRIVKFPRDIMKKSFKEVIDYIKPPYKVGDILYVRETWNINPSWEFDKNYINLPSKESKYIYKATNDFNGGWKPSIHMPKEAARIFLKVTSVRAERLKDITDEGCYQEGISGTSFYDEAEHIQIAGIGLNDSLERTAFSLLWNSTVREEKYSWEGNPWVWVIGFKRIEIVK
ncbi:hypothetical protein [Clostridium perfringens]|uniref:hypothetical protein n=1 Tax=Clostridium perfringens TaxID=1502 RepID=UPI001ABBA61E|nr:hypothetical protein [Clostridium perfringens]MBO3333458.1 hypothetical protein [Clostridium perfringens]